MAKKYPKLSAVLKKLLFERDMKSVDLARAVDMPAPTVHRLVTGKSTRPYKSSLKPIADYFDISVDTLLGEDDEIIAPAQTNKKTLPILSWEQLSDPQATKNDAEKIPVDSTLSDKCFASKMHDTSMEPYFNQGSILIFDPDKALKDRTFILVQLKNNDLAIFRQLIVDGDDNYIRALNPDLSATSMRLLSTSDKILGILVEARYVYDEII